MKHVKSAETEESARLQPLFETEEAYESFKSRHQDSRVGRCELDTYEGNCFLGIDAGSTTTKVALINEAGELLFTHYGSNQGIHFNLALLF